MKGKTALYKILLQNCDCFCGNSGGSRKRKGFRRFVFSVAETMALPKFIAGLLAVPSETVPGAVFFKNADICFWFFVYGSGFFYIGCYCKSRQNFVIVF